MKSYTTWFLYLIHIDTYIRNQLTLLLAYKRYTTWHNYSKVETWQAVDLVNSPGHVDIRSRGAGSLLDGIRRKIVGGRQLLEYLSKIKSLRVVNSGREKAQPGQLYFSPGNLEIIRIFSKRSLAFRFLLS